MGSRGNNIKKSVEQITNIANSWSVIQSALPTKEKKSLINSKKKKRLPQGQLQKLPHGQII